eukprot:CAMPEP_0182421370 /NCGR_PEP_ID=MMETSP1167-20130531/6733_1 /TAXON_ID=2988 /ORGANISM="Mallomonas Sp, Strain CCMP3275" /LENGTH=128 /DNA_ID=CAMNT_0024598437 /DNA_START=127 /DNA_END=513 /DNA_ORIENTATION=-
MALLDSSVISVAGVARNSRSMQPSASLTASRSTCSASSPLIARHRITVSTTGVGSTTAIAEERLLLLTLVLSILLGAVVFDLDATCLAPPPSVRAAGAHPSSADSLARLTTPPPLSDTRAEVPETGSL